MTVTSLDTPAGWILELDRGHGIPYEGTTLLVRAKKMLDYRLKQNNKRPIKKAIKSGA